MLFERGGEAAGGAVAAGGCCGADANRLAHQQKQGVFHAQLAQQHGEAGVFGEQAAFEGADAQAERGGGLGLRPRQVQLGSEQAFEFFGGTEGFALRKPPALRVEQGEQVQHVSAFGFGRLYQFLPNGGQRGIGAGVEGEGAGRGALCGEGVDVALGNQQQFGRVGFAQRGLLDNLPFAAPLETEYFARGDADVALGLRQDFAA